MTSPTPHAPSPAPTKPDAACPIALPIIERLCDTIAGENDALAAGRTIDWHAASLRKSQGLFELKRVAPSLDRASVNLALRVALADLLAKLEVNRRALGVQLEACAAVSELIAKAIRDGQSDGTYESLGWARARP